MRQHNKLSSLSGPVSLGMGKHQFRDAPLIRESVEFPLTPPAISATVNVQIILFTPPPRTACPPPRAQPHLPLRRPRSSSQMVFRIFLTLLPLILLFSGCGGPPEPAAGRPDLIVALQAPGKSLDPHVVTDAASMRLIELMYSTLMRYRGIDGAVEPWLAREAAWNHDHTRLTLTLHPNAVFHRTGRPVTAHDVIYSLQRIREKGARADQLAAIKSMHAPDDLTVVLQLHSPSAPLLTALASPMNAIVDRQTVEAHHGSLASIDAGCGPYRLVQWRKGEFLDLEAAPAYFEPGLPRIPTLRLRPITDETARTTALRTGEVDLLPDLPAKDIPLVESHPGITVQRVQSTFWEYLGINTRTPPLDSPRVRRALAMALDRVSLLKLVKFGEGRVLDSGPIPPGHWAHLDTPLYSEPAPAAARALLAQAGLPENISLTLTVGSAFPYQVDAAQVVKQQLQSAGITIRIEALESGVFFDRLNRGDFQLTLVGWLGFVDPDEWLHNLFHSRGKWNQQGYANPEVDTLLETGRRLLDPESRAVVYRQAQHIIASEAPMAFLYINNLITAHHRSLRNFRPHPTGTLRGLRHATLNHPD